MGFFWDLYGSVIGYTYFAEATATAAFEYDYFDSREEALEWAREHRPAKVYRLLKGSSQFYGEIGKDPQGNAELIKTVR